RGTVKRGRLAGGLPGGPRRDQPIPGADHLPGDQRLARLTPRVEGHVAQAGEEEQQAGDEQEERGPHCASASRSGVRSLSLAGRAVSVARAWWSRSPSTTPRAGAIATST